MAYDIYGNILRHGHCEVHPAVHEEYPCSLCMAQKQQSQQQPEYDKVGELEHYLGQARQEIARLQAEVTNLRNERDQYEWGVLSDRVDELEEAVRCVLPYHAHISSFVMNKLHKALKETTE